MALNILPGTNLDNGIKQNTEDITLPVVLFPLNYQSIQNPHGFIVIIRSILQMKKCLQMKTMQD